MGGLTHFIIIIIFLHQSEAAIQETPVMPHPCKMHISMPETGICLEPIVLLKPTADTFWSVKILEILGYFIWRMKILTCWGLGAVEKVRNHQSLISIKDQDYLHRNVVTSNNCWNYSSADKSVGQISISVFLKIFFYLSGTMSEGKDQSGRRCCGLYFCRQCLQLII